MGAVDGRLRPLLDSYGGYVERSTRPVVRREVPVPRVMVIIGMGGPLTVYRGGAASSGSRMSSFVAGLSLGPTVVEHAGAQNCVELRLTPLGAYRLLGVSISEITGRVVDLADVWGGAAVELAERLAEASGWASRYDLLDQMLLRAAAAGRLPEPELVGCWHRLDRRRGNLAISELLSDTGWSRRRLAERFRDQVGLAPKQISRVLRFHRAVQFLGRSDNPALASIAAACGFSDQAHFHRDFRALAGCTPTEYRAARLPDLPGTGVGPGPAGPVPVPPGPAEVAPSL